MLERGLIKYSVYFWFDDIDYDTQVELIDRIFNLTDHNIVESDYSGVSHLCVVAETMETNIKERQEKLIAEIKRIKEELTLDN